ncbi:MAG TPA: tetratricopeptide repeat protein [Methylibium sp.]|nr:tetratricopeptide repeat protein [Methylibium sp.]
MAPLRLQLLGPPAAVVGGESLALPVERRSQLVALLALRRGWVGRAELAALLWPEQPARLAHANLRKTLFRLDAVPWGRAVEVQDSALRLRADTDVADFEAALAAQRIDEALALRRGELLAGFDDDAGESWSGWLAFERERLRNAWRDAALARLAGGIEPGEGVDLSARLLDADPLDEAALRSHMVWLARSGHTARARRAYQAYAARLAQELGLAPGAELKALHDGLGHEAAAAPAPRAAEDEGFVGRSSERRRIAELLARPDCRLLCLLGPGGVGKTRLARHAARELAPGWPDGAVFVALDDVAAPAEFGGRLARELAVPRGGGAEPFERVVEFLRPLQRLLVLDNFEQLVDAAGLLGRLLDACPRLKILVTSRVRLGVAGEWSLPLDGLPCPEPEDADCAESFDAVRLFVAAARRVEPALDARAQAAAIVDICRQVDGLPLALELAAAWTRVLPCDAIAAELRQGSELLRSADASRPARQASFEAVFESSWRLLSDVEREALARLAVFRGGFSADAARAVAAAPLPVLGALADKSLLHRQGARSALHPLVQQLAGERLGAAREAAEAAHAQHFLRLLAQRRRPAENAEPASLQWLEAEFENCKAAWHAAVARGRWAALDAAAWALLHYADHRGHFGEALALLRAAIAAAPDGAPLLTSAAAHVEYRLDRYAEALADAERALAASTSTDHDTRLQCFKVLGVCSLRLGRFEDARRWLQRALRQSPAETDPRNAATMLDNLALVEKRLGNFEASLRMSTASLVQLRRLGDVAGEALCLNNLGALLLDHGDLAAAAVHCKESLALSERHGLSRTAGHALANLSELSLKTGDLEAAAGYSRRAYEMAVQTGSRAIQSWLRNVDARIALARGDLAAARALLRESLETAAAIDLTTIVTGGLSCFAELLAAQGEPEAARRVLDFAAAHPSTDAQNRHDIAALRARWPEGPAPWPGLAFEELVQRIVVETPTAHAALIAAVLGR